MGKISYTQVSMYEQCPWKWKLTYIDGHRDFNGNIHTVFGTAMHEVMQMYLLVMYGQTAKKADELPLKNMLMHRLRENYKQLKEADPETNIKKSEMMEFYNDGCDILDFFKKKRGEYFSKKGYRLIGCEIPLENKLPKNISWVGYIDIVMLDEITNTIKIYDIKTSTQGWNKWMKADKSKTSQLLFYKKFYSELYNHPIDKIEIEFFILKRKLWENAAFPQKRIQKFVPASGKPSINKAYKMVDNFIDQAFLEDGSYNMNHDFIKKASQKACRWCEFAKTEHCEGWKK